jgi:hypothetical protein
MANSALLASSAQADIYKMATGDTAGPVEGGAGRQLHAERAASDE